MMITKTLASLALSLALLPLAPQRAQAQRIHVNDPGRIRSVQLIVDGDPMLPPILRKGSRKQIELNFDEMSHDYHRLLYRISHCSYDWRTPDENNGESLFESDYLGGLNGQPLDDYDISFNTTQLYTHYRLRFPSREISLRLSGNYCLEVFDEDDYGSPDAQPLLKAEFCITEQAMSVAAQVSSNTDVDFNATNQQLTYSIAYGSLPVADPLRELHTVVKQNRRDDNAVRDLRPNIIKQTGVEFTHRRELIFEAGNEFHKFETIDMHHPNLNVDFMRFYAPYYHFMLLPNRPQRNYSYDQDKNGLFLLRNAEYDDEELTSEYAWVHFTLTTGEALEGGDPFVCGLWTNGDWDPLCRMTWNEESGQYEAAVFLKQGYYNYQYRQPGSDGLTGTTARTDGNFYETENEYSIFVYYRKPNDRYDRLACYYAVTYK